MANSTNTTVTLFLSADVDLQGTSINGELYFDNLGASSSDDVSSNGFGNVDLLHTTSDAEIVFGEGLELADFSEEMWEDANFKIKVREGNEKETLKLDFELASDKLIALSGSEIIAESSAATVGSLSVDGVSVDQVLESPRVSDDRFEAALVNGEYVLRLKSGMSVDEAGELSITVTVETTEAIYADTMVITVAEATETLSGSGQDGYLEGSLVWADNNSDGTYDVGVEASGFTDSFGNFMLSGNTSGILHLVGGTDVATLLHFDGKMLAPDGSSVISPVTTLIVAVMQSGTGMTAAQAEVTVKAAFGLDPLVNLTQYDPIAVLANPVATAEQKFAAANIFAVGTTVLNSATIAGELLAGSGAGVAPSFMEAEAAVYDALAANVIAAVGSSSTVDLSDASTVETLVTDAATLLGFTPSEVAAVDASDAAELISGANSLVDDETPDTVSDADTLIGTEFLTDTTEVAAVAQGEIADAVSDGDVSVSDTASYTSDALLDQISDAEIGEVAPSTLVGSDGADIIVGNALLDDFIYGLDGSDTLSGLGGNDSIFGGGSDDVIDGGAGNDHLDGGSDNDTVDYSSALQAMDINIVLGEAIDRGDFNDQSDDGFVETDIILGFENVIGTDFDDLIWASQVANSLDGGGGVDTAIYIIAGLASGNGGFDISWQSDGSITAINKADASDIDELQNIEVIIDSLGNDTITGNNSDNAIALFGGVDAVDGGLGTDTLIYLGDTEVAVDLVAGTGDKGMDGLTTPDDSISGIDNVIGSAGNDRLLGNASDNVLAGHRGDDTLLGGAGNDTIDGGQSTLFSGALDPASDGIDTASYEQDPNGVTVNLTTGTAIDGWGSDDTLISIENVTGSAFSDTITGDAGENFITGGAGVDTLDGSDGVDTISFLQDDLAGAAGLDITISGTTVTSFNAVSGETETALRFENVLDSQGNDTVTGDAGNNAFLTILGADHFEGNGGVDTLTYLSVAGTSTTVDLEAGTATKGLGFIDTLSSIENIGIFTLSSQPASNDTLQGDSADNILAGGLGDDTLMGRAGHDTLDGGLASLPNITDPDAQGGGNDTADYSADIAGVTVNLASGTAVDGWGSDDTLISIENVIGSAHNDSLTGDASENRIEGGGGSDAVSGGFGTDTFVFDALSGHDTIHDFELGEIFELPDDWTVVTDTTTSPGDTIVTFEDATLTPVADVSVTLVGVTATPGDIAVV